jgi:hypothetical protein
MSLLAIQELSGRYDLMVSISPSKSKLINKYDNLIIKLLNRYESNNFLSVKEIEVSDFMEENIYCYCIKLKDDKNISNKLIEFCKKIDRRCDRHISNRMNFVLPLQYN